MMVSRLLTCRLRPAWIVVCVVLAAMASAAPARGQFSSVWAAEEMHLGQQANLFAYWDGRAALDGVLVELPPGWTLEDAQALRHGYEQVLFTVYLEDPDRNRYVAAAPHGLNGAHALILRVQTGGLPGRVSWSAVPFLRRNDRGEARLIPRETYRITQTTRLDEPMPALDNRVLAFRSGGAPWLLRRVALPDLDARAAYTVELWMRTTTLNEVVLSAWDGDERTAYPLELVVDAGGRLRYYRGQPGRHESMATPVPVADGQWHHVALVNEGPSGWTRLFLDGAAADSLYSPAPPLIRQRAALALGGRVPAPDASFQGGAGYTGLLDELRLWPHARPVAEIRRTMRQPMKSTTPGAVLLGFETPIPPVLVARRTVGTERIYADLAFYLPVSNVQAVLDGEAVLLTWETEDLHTTSFLVERSTDGRTFAPLGEVSLAEAAAVHVPATPGRYGFRDADLSAQVVFYRIRQRFEGGAERLSGTIKLGLGREEQAAVALVGNFPNPFNPATTIVYEVRQAQRVRVSVWDLSGQQVAVLVDRVQQPGTYDVHFDGSDLPSGTYFVRLQSRRASVQVHKMILMK